ncbi:MAG: hypothetical protein AVDCRST_MAG73-2979, partial [uncultured Thermomicrobiales bacterium]
GGRDVSGSSGLAGWHRVGGASVRGDAGVPCRGAVPLDESGAAGGRVRAVKYCGRACPRRAKGIPPPRLHRPRLAGRGRDPFRDRRPARLPSVTGPRSAPGRDQRPCSPTHRPPHLAIPKRL